MKEQPIINVLGYLFTIGAEGVLLRADSRKPGLLEWSEYPDHEGTLAQDIVAQLIAALDS